MYAPPYYREKSLKRMIELIKKHGFGVIVSSAGGEIMATHLPLLVEQEPASGDTQISLIGHFAAANKQARKLQDGASVLCVFSGPSGYITPNWYDDEEDVPTYNYSAVHVRGEYLTVSEPLRARAILERTVYKYEKSEPQPWKMEDIDPAIIEKFLREVTCFSIKVTAIEGASKHSQDKSANDQTGVMTGLCERAAHEDILLMGEMERSYEQARRKRD